MLGGYFTKTIEGKTCKKNCNSICQKKEILGTSKTFLFCTLQLLQSALK